MSEASDDEDIFATDAQRELRAAARRYLDRGWKLVRLRQGTKRAFDKGWPNRDVTPEQFSHEMNIGLRFGPQSGGLVDVDLDYASARELVGRPVFRLNHLVEFGRSSLPPGRRGHRLVIAPDGPDKTRVFGIRGKAAKAAMEALGLGFTIAEIRASHGSQSAVPPSVHVGPNGDDPLVWTAPAGDAAEIPTLAWDTLNERVGRLALCSLAAVLYPRGPATRDEFCGRLLGTLLEGKALPMPAEAMVCEVARLNGDETDFHAPDAMEGLEGFLDLVGLTAIAPVVAPWLGLRPSPDAVPDDGEDEDVHTNAASSAAHNAPVRIIADDLKLLIEVLDPSEFTGHHEWRDLLYACHHASGGSSEGLRIVVQFCREIPGYETAKGSHQVRRLWQDAKPSGAITLRTLLRYVIDAGRGDLVRSVMREYEIIEDLRLFDDGFDPDPPDDGPMLIDASQVEDPFKSDAEIEE